MSPRSIGFSPPSYKLSSKDPVAMFPFQRQSCHKYNPLLLTSQSSPCGHSFPSHTTNDSPVVVFPTAPTRTAPGKTTPGEKLHPPRYQQETGEALLCQDLSSLLYIQGLQPHLLESIKMAVHQEKGSRPQPGSNITEHCLCTACSSRGFPGAQGRY